MNDLTYTIPLIVRGANGRLGRSLCSAIEHRGDYNLLAKIWKKNSLRDLENNLSAYKHYTPKPILIDVSTFGGEFIPLNCIADYCSGYIVASTGIGEQNEKEIEKLSGRIEVIKKANFSTRYRDFFELVDFARYMREIKTIIIEEFHPNYKRDKPSATALELRDYLNARKYDDPYFVVRSFRDGRTGSIHNVSFQFSDGQRIGISLENKFGFTYTKGILKAADKMWKTISEKEKRKYDESARLRNR